MKKLVLLAFLFASCEKEKVTPPCDCYDVTEVLKMSFPTPVTMTTYWQFESQTPIYKDFCFNAHDWRDNGVKRTKTVCN